MYIYIVYMWQKSSVFSHESAQRNVAGHLVDKNIFKTTRSFRYQWFRVSTHQFLDGRRQQRVSRLKIWMVYSHLPDEWKHETIGSEMTVLF